MKRIFFTIVLLISSLLFANEKFDSLLASAESGNADACYDLSLCYQNGYFDVEKDTEKFIYWAQKAANAGNSDAMADLGIHYLTIENDWKTAKKYLDMSIKQQNPRGFYMYGYCYSNAVGVKKDIKKGIDNYQRASSLGYTMADYQLGEIYYIGTDVPQDEAKAFTYFLKAAESGDAEAQAQVGYMYEKGVGVTADRAKSFEWNEKAALQGNTRGMLSCGIDLMQGKVVPRDSERGLSYLLQITEGPDTSEKKYAYDMLHMVYRFGIGVKADPQKAKEYKQKYQELAGKP
ncbi:MAG: sel1 repeat family protein [Treponema sp.]|nr:sel1 repeat family protein [Treponema sp.]